MADPYIDQYEVLGYGAFTETQVGGLVIGLDPVFDKALKHVVGLLHQRTEEMRACLERVASHEAVTYKPADGAENVIEVGRDVLRRLSAYARSRRGGDKLAEELLNGQSLTTVTRQRPAKLVQSLRQALQVVERAKKQLPEHASWTKELTDAHDALRALDTRVRAARIERRAMTPEVSAAREAWLKVYGALKLQVECVLRLHDRLSLLPEVFDDLAEVHRVPGVTDEPNPSGPPSPPPAPTPA